MSDRVGGRNAADWRESRRLRLMMPAEGVPLDAVLGTPAVGQLAADGPKLGEKLVAHAVFEDFDGPAFQGFGVQADAAMDQLHVLEAEFLEEFVEFRQSFGDHVRIAVSVAGVVDFLDRKAMLIKVVFLERIPDRLIHLEQDAESRRLLAAAVA